MNAKRSRLLLASLVECLSEGGVFKYDFNLEWTYNDSQFDGHLPPIKADNSGKPDLFAALQQFGLRLESTKGAIPVIVIDHVERDLAALYAINFMNHE